MPHRTSGSGRFTVVARGTRRVIVILSAAMLWPVSASWAQLAHPNEMGVTMGHLHYHVRDVELAKKFWIALGGRPVKLGATDVIKFPDVLVFLTKGEISGGTVGSVLDHPSFQVPNTAPTVAALKAAGAKVEDEQNPIEIFVFTPDGDRIEVFNELTENSKFAPDPGLDGAAAQRLNRKMTVPIMSHHIHLFVPEGTEGEAQAWYVKTFGAVPGTRFRFKAVDLPGMNVNFSRARAATVPTKGRTLDHVGFEVKNLDAFCKKLQASGVKFDVPYAKHDGIASAFLTDPWGTSIELTEGLSGL